MDWDVIEGNWKQIKSKVKQQWGNLSNEQLDMISGRRDQLIAQIQECYGVERDEAERQVTEWELQYGDTLDNGRRRIRLRKNVDAAQH